MELRRAKQIISSPEEVVVLYNGESVWLDQVHEDGKTATVHLRDAMGERSEVAISELREQ